LAPAVAAVLIVIPYGLVFLLMALALRVDGAMTMIRMVVRRGAS